ncbi:MAG: helix-turn-helix transcriptional regulator [Planctomycetota bacterium]
MVCISDEVELLPSPATPEILDLRGEVQQQLTPMQFRIFQMLGAGFSVPETARILNRSVKTVENHAAEVRVRLGVTGAAGVARIAGRLFYAVP